jgi:uncharacterized protein (TIGR02147 family)
MKNKEENNLPDYRDWIKQVLLTRQSTNPRYSLRAFSRDLGVTVQHLSAVFNSKKNISTDLAESISKKLGFSEKREEKFLQLVEFETAQTLQAKKRVFNRMKESFSEVLISDQKMDEFELISNWYHLPLVELTELSRFKLTPESAAKKLGISVLATKDALERLCRLRILNFDGVTYTKVNSTYHFRSALENNALKEYNRTNIDRALKALDEQPSSERLYGNQVLAIDPSDLKKAEKILLEARLKLENLFSKSKNRSEVYHFGFQFFRQTKGEKK